MKILLAMLVLLAAAIGAQADTVRTLDGKVLHGTASIDASGALSVAPAPGQAGQPVAVPFAQLLAARIDSKTTAPTDTVDFDWLGVDVGDVGSAGSQSWQRGQLKVEAAGAGFVKAADSFRMVYSPLPGDGDVSAHVLPDANPQPGTRAGVIIRSSAESGATGVQLLTTPEGSIILSTRMDPNQGVIPEKVLATERGPIWLRLVCKGNNVTAFKSTDGKLWNSLGGCYVKFSPNKNAGVCLTSGDKLKTTVATFEKPRVYVDQPAGVTITDLNDLKGIRTQRLPHDHGENLNFGSVNSAPIDRNVPAGTSCEVRYNLDGKFTTLAGSNDVSDAKISGGGGTAVFQIFADNEKLFETPPMKAGDPPSYIDVDVRGKKELRLVINHATGQYYSADFRYMRLQNASSARAVARTQTSTIYTTTGSIYANCEVRGLTKDTLQFSRGDRRDLSLPLDQVARINMPGLTPQMIAQIPATDTGVLMASGDFYQGEIDQLSGDTVRVNSVIFGPKEFAIRGDALAVALRAIPSAPAASQYVLETDDGSTLLTDSLSGESGKLVVTDKSIGRLVVAIGNVRGLHYSGDRLKNLTDIRPRSIDNAPDRGATSFLIDASPLGSALNLTGGDVDHGLGLAAGASVTYDLDGQYTTLLCGAGVPAESLPVNSAVFVISSDGKELFRSPPRTSIQDVLPISVDLTGLKSITLHVEAGKNSVLPVCGLYSDPLLVKNSH